MHFGMISDGHLLMAMTEDDLNVMLQSVTELHQRAFQQSLFSLRELGVKPPSNLWHYKVNNSVKGIIRPNVDEVHISCRAPRGFLQGASTTHSASITHFSHRTSRGFVQLAYRTPRGSLQGAHIALKTDF